MFKDKKILALIPARGGSKGIPHKNIIDLCGKPLIAYSIEAGLNSKYIDYVLVSTDDHEIASVSMDFGAEVPFMRPASLATDTAKTIDSVLYSIDELKQMNLLFDVLILLQPTQPLRTHIDIDEAIECFFNNCAKPLVSVCEVNDNPVLIREIVNGILNPILPVLSTVRRQDMPKYYRVNGCIYINMIEEICPSTSFNDNEIPFVMNKNHSVDIDEMADVWLAECYLKNC